ncbi:response regulator [Chitinophaga sp. GCM10012297]|uniref:Response regulator n=1 Tax=Chitinophaga chungangae TaxID=2821488 RepID=A0ABS3YAR6_9BACT|nr:response regulator [Chitinophaga chungangae]MBO9151777.1 response regulator [Chitinophaga chungangae]
MAKILIVDDDPSILEAISLVLTRKNIDVVSLNDASTLQSALREQEPDMLLMDIFMGIFDGRNLCREIKRSQTDIPVVLISGHVVSNESVAECYADALLIKPFRLNELYDVIEKFLH